MTSDRQGPALEKPQNSSRFSPVTAIFLIVLVDVLGYTIILPILPFYAEKFGAGCYLQKIIRMVAKSAHLWWVPFVKYSMDGDHHAP